MTQKRIQITSSLIKAVKDEEACPARIKAIYYDKIERVPTESMLKGLFFETLCLGTTTDGSKVETLPRLKNDNKSTDQIRIEDQAAKFLNELVKYYDIVLSPSGLRPEPCVPIEGFDDRYEFLCHFDFVSPFRDVTLDKEKPQELAIIDLKLTKTIGTFGEWCWGRPELMDHTQAHSYVTIWEMVYGVELPFYYMVFEYGPTMKYKVIRKVVTAMHKQEFHESVRRTIATLELWEQTGWKEHPSYDKCTSCPIAKHCPMYKMGRDIDVIS